jgi:hypothetical protein
MTVVNTDNVHEISAAGGGLKIGNSATEKLGLYGKTPIVQQTAPTIVLAIDPTVSTSALVASIHSIAVYSASTVNRVVLALSNIGVYV